jgi:hypothetical protein
MPSAKAASSPFFTTHPNLPLFLNLLLNARRSARARDRDAAPLREEEAEETRMRPRPQRARRREESNASVRNG